MKNQLNLKCNHILFLSFASVLLLSSCSVFKPVKSESTNTYAIEAQFPPVTAGTGELTLLLSMPTARAGYESARMIYLKKAYEIEHFSQNQWVDSPARMLAPLLVQALERSAKYRAVIPPRSVVSADLRLDTEIVRLQQEFLTKPSQLHLILRAQLIDLRSKAVIATQEFDVIENASSDDPYGGVLATNRAVKLLLQQVADFCVQGSKSATLKGKNE
jgi:cholesterol transport system auxiliary component